MSEPFDDGRRPTARLIRDAIFAGPVRSLEEWGALTADDWAAVVALIDENPHWNIQHVIEHFIGGPRITPPPVEPAAVVEYPPVPPTLPVSIPKRSRKKPDPEVRKRLSRVRPPVLAELPVFLPLPPILTFLPPVLAPEPPVFPPEPPVIVPELPVLAPEPSVRAFLPPVIAELPVSLPLPPILTFLPPVLAPEPPVFPPEPSVIASVIAPEPPVFLPLPPVLIFLPPVLKWDLAAAAEPEPANEHEPAVEAPLVPGPLAGTYVLMPHPLWEARHNVSLDAWASKVTALVKAYGPFPDRDVIIVSIRYSGGRDSTKEQYEQHVERCVAAASTLIRHIRSSGGQENRQFLVYPWIRTAISSTDDWFKRTFHLFNLRHGIPRTRLSTCRLKELEFVLDNLQPDTKVWWLSIGIDGLTTDIENLRRTQTHWPALHFTVAIMVHSSFCPDVSQFGHQDICPRRPAVSGMRIRIYSFARLLSGAHNLGDRPARKLLAVWQYINDAKLNGASYDRCLVNARNTMPVAPGGIDTRGIMGDMM